jgi:hypothetical protein
LAFISSYGNERYGVRFFALLVLLSSTLVSSHEGPPYPILVNHEFSEKRLTIMADPDVGEGLFQHYLEGNNLDEVSEVEIQARPLFLDEASKSFTSIEVSKGKWETRVPFAEEGEWELIVSIKKGDHVLTSKKIDVEVTPPGPSKKEFVLYLLPFLAIGFIWIKAIFKKMAK